MFSKFLIHASISIGVILLAAFFHVAPASAESLSGAEFRKLVIGNTLHQKVWSNRRGEELEFMYHFVNAKQLLFSSAQSAPTETYEWNNSDEGKFCYTHTYRRTRVICHHGFSVKGNTLTEIRSNKKAKKRIFTLLKGKHEAEKKFKYR